MNLFPAIDLKNGNVVRLTQGDYNIVEVYASDPVKTAIDFIAQGAKNLHVVDLDGAKGGTENNFESIRNIAKIKELYIEVGGGIRDEARIVQYLELGVNRVILGTVAAEDFDFTTKMIKKYGEQIAIGVDERAGKVAINGWTQTVELNSIEFCQQLDNIGVSTIIYTDISKDGAMTGTNLDVYLELSKKVGCNIIAAGGISYMSEIIALRDMGLYGAILGKALYTGALDLRKVAELC